MLLSLILHLKPLTPSLPPDPLGRAVHSFFLEQVRKFDPPLAQELHNSSGAKPFTTSGLRQTRLEDGSSDFWLRLTTFETHLSKMIKEQVIPGLEKQIEQARAALLSHDPVSPSPGWQITLGDMLFAPLSLTLDPALHPWAGQTTYNAIAQTKLLATLRPARTFELSFASPTTFHTHGDQHLPLPLPEMLVGSWLSRWNAFAPVAFPEETRSYAAEHLAVSRYQLKTEALHYGKASFIGFTGRCTFRLLDDDPYWSRILHTLAYFSLYCGSGAKTTMGMGQTRIID